MTHLKIEVVASKKKAKSLDFNLIYVFTEFSAFKHLNHESFFFLHGVIDNFEQFKFSIFFAKKSFNHWNDFSFATKKSKEKVELPKGLENQSH